MIFNIEMTMKVSKNLLQRIMAVLSDSKSWNENSYDVTVNNSTLLGITTSYTVIIKTNDMKLIEAVAAAVSAK